MRHALLVVTACGLMWSPVPAQAQRTLSLALAGGVSLPVGDFADGTRTGWHAAAGLVLSSLWQPIALRADVTRHQFGFEGDESGHLAITSGTLSVLYRLPSAGSAIAPYIAAGAGAYHASCGGDASCDSDTLFGWSAGGGARAVILGLHSFVEARYHSVMRGGPNARFIPLTVGVTL